MEEEIIEIETEDTEQEIETEEDIIVVKPILQEKSVTPKKVIQEVIPDENYNGLSKVIVEPYEAITGELNATSNGTYKAIEQGLDGFDIVNVETEGLDPSEIFNSKITPNTYSNGQWAEIIKKIPITVSISNGILYGLFSSFPQNVEVPIITIPDNKVRNAYNAFGYATLNSKNIENIESLDFSSCTNLTYLFRYAKTVGTIQPPQNIDCSSATSLQLMFGDSKFSGEINLKNTQNIQYFTQFAENCSKITKIGVLDCSSAIVLTNFFRGCISLKEIGGLANLGKAYSTSVVQNYSEYTLDLTSCSKLTHESVINIFNNLYNISEKGVKPQLIKLNSMTKRILTDDDIKIATDKGWTIQ